MLSRRRFVAGVTAGLGIAGLASPFALNAASNRLALPESRRRSLLAALAMEDSRFDPFAKMLVASVPDDSGGYTTLKGGSVHATHPSIQYAVASLDSGERWRLDRAKEIMRVLVGLQDVNPASRTHGLWPWYLEEPLDKITQPDPSLAEACGMPLLSAWVLHREEIGKKLSEDIREAVLHAARAIRRRDVDFRETTSAVAGTGLLLLAAQEFKLPDLRAQAKERLKQLHDHILRQGSFAEYNSPLCTVSVLQELSRMLWLAKDGRDTALIRPVHDLAWQHAALHFHAPTRQWAGPHGWSRETDLRKQPDVLAVVQAACGGKGNFGLSDPLPLSLSAYHLPLECPRKLVKHFVQLDAPHQTVETFVKGEPNTPGARSPVVGTTWLHPRYTLGSVNRADLWEHRRPLVAYWGKPATGRHLRVRFLKDNRDFASALFFSAQHEGSLLAAVAFATDHGDTHPLLDPVKDATIRARDLRLRFEFGGEGEELTARTGGDQHKHLVIQDRDIRWIIRPVADAFDGEKFKWDFPELKLVNHIDAIAYQGDERTFKLDELSRAFAFFSLEEWPLDQPELQTNKLDFSQDASSAVATMVADGKFLRLSVPPSPQKAATSFDVFAASVRNATATDLTPSKPI